jgi:hypothetical protein
VDSVHGSWTSTGCGPLWTDHHGQPQSLTVLGRAAAPGHSSPPEVAQRGEGCTGSPSLASPGRGRSEALGAGNTWAHREEKESGERCGGEQ